MKSLKVFIVVLLTCSVADAKSGGELAFLQSLVVPGWGQYSLEARHSALVFFGAELLLLGGALSTQAYGLATRDDYEALAASHAGVRGEHGHDYYVDVGNWISVHEFNQKRLRDREFDRLYSSDGDYWYWDSEENRSKMEKLRVQSDQSLNAIYYFAGGMILNHLASAIHAGRMSSKLRDPLDVKHSSTKPVLDLQPLTGLHLIGMSVKLHF